MSDVIDLSSSISDIEIDEHVIPVSSTTDVENDLVGEEESSLSDIAFDDNEASNNADILETKNLAEMLINERLKHEASTNYDAQVLDALDLIGIEKEQEQAKSNRSIRDLLKARQADLVESPSFVLSEVLKLKDDDGTDSIFDSMPVWMQFAVETSPFSINESTRGKRLEAYLSHHKELRYFERLHEEIIGLLGWLEPSDTEIELRRRAVARIENIARRLWPECECSVFGSVASGLILPTGDVDINITGVTGQSDKQNLRLLASHLSHWKLVRCMEVVLSAKVPIIKAIDIVTEYPIDITLNQPSSVETTRFVKRQMKIHPHLRPLILILKVYLQQRNLAETYHGGIGSYLLFCMCLAFLQQHMATSDPAVFATLTLGHLLFDFFQFYGHDHAYTTMGLSVRNGGEMYLKKARGFHVPDRPYLLSIQSPLDPSVDVGKNSYNIAIIRDAFKKTYARLCHCFKEWSESKGEFPRERSILTEVVLPHDVLFTRQLPYESIREKIRHFKSCGGDEAEPKFTQWLEKGTDFEGVAPYPSRLNHLSHPRPGLHVDDQLRKETKTHFHKFFDMVVKLRQLRRDAIRRADREKYHEKERVEAQNEKKRAREEEGEIPNTKKQKIVESRSSPVEEGLITEDTSKGPEKAEVSSLIPGVPPLSNVVTNSRVVGERFDPLMGFLGTVVDQEDGDNTILDAPSRQWSDSM